MPIYKKQNTDGMPRLSVSNTRDLYYVSQSLFQITGPIAIWDFFTEAATDIPSNGLNFRVVIAPNSGEGKVENLALETSTFFTTFPQGYRWFLTPPEGNSQLSEDQINFTGSPPICRFVTSGTLYQCTTSSTGSPPEFRYYMIWSPLSESSNVIVL